MDYNDYSIQYIKGVGEKRARLFNKLGIFDVGGLIHFYPRKYIDWNNTVTVKQADSGDIAFIKATMITPVKESLIRKGLTLYKCNFTDGETVIHVTIFNNKYLAKSLRTFDDYVLYGKIEKNFTEARMSSPQIEKADNKPGIQPVYPATENLNSKAISKAVKSALDKIEFFEDTLSDEIKQQYNLCSLDWAIRQIHFPTDLDNVEKARKRLIFDELLTLRLGLIKFKSKKQIKIIIN